MSPVAQMLFADDAVGDHHAGLVVDPFGHLGGLGGVLDSRRGVAADALHDRAGQVRVEAGVRVAAVGSELGGAVGPTHGFVELAEVAVGHAQLAGSDGRVIHPTGIDQGWQDGLDEVHGRVELRGHEVGLPPGQHSDRHELARAGLLGQCRGLIQRLREFRAGADLVAGHGTRAGDQEVRPCGRGRVTHDRGVGDGAIQQRSAVVERQEVDTGRGLDESHRGAHAALPGVDLVIGRQQRQGAAREVHGFVAGETRAGQACRKCQELDGSRSVVGLLEVPREDGSQLIVVGVQRQQALGHGQVQRASLRLEQRCVRGILDERMAEGVLELG